MDFEPSTTAVTPFRSSQFGTPSRSLNLSTASDHTVTSIDRDALEIQYNLQIKYANSLVRQATATSRDPTEDGDRLVNVTPLPWSTRLARQGPFLFQPAPSDLDNGAESSACDIAYINYIGSRTESEDDQSLPGIGVLAVAFSDGKVDLCLEVEKVEARWESLDGREEEDGQDAPTLAVYETIDLGLAAALQEASKDVGSALESNVPSFVKDPLYPDTLYIYHSLGAHCLLLTSWLDSLLELATSAEESSEKLVGDAEHALRAQPRTDVLWILKTVSVDDEDVNPSPPPVVGLSVINDVFLGYSLLLVTSSLQLVGIELSLRVDPSLLPSTSDAAPSTRGVSSDPPAYLSFLDLR